MKEKTKTVRRKTIPAAQPQPFNDLPATKEVVTMPGKTLDLKMIMNTKVLTADKNTSTYDALKKMAERRVGSIVVLEGGAPVGIFTERDLLHKVVLSRKDLAVTRLEDVMTREIVALSKKSALDDAYSKMQAGNFRHLLIVDDGKLEGIVSIKDLAKVRTMILEKKVEEKTRELTHVCDRLSTTLHQIEQEMATAGALQKSLIQKKFPAVKNIKISYIYEQADSIGGDYFEVVRKGKNALGIFVADVMGHGITSAILATTLKMYLLRYYPKFTSPGELITFINSEISSLIPPAFFIAGFCGFLNTESLEMTYTHFGLPLPGILRGTTGKYENIPPVALPIGINANTNYQDQSVQIQRGDQLLLFTDGCTEQKNMDEEILGDKRFIQHFKSVASGKESDPARSLYNFVIEFAGGKKISDDIAVLLFEFVK
ncbi:MAG: SpoIIE family protein phosphatase [bacterium]